MKKHYIKMNDNKNYLSFGNVVNVIKKVSNNKNALQVEIFSSIFDVNDVNATTINNYCIGIRAIGLEYRKSFSNKYDCNKELFINNIISLLNILDDKIYSKDNTLELINKNEKLKLVINELLTIAQNDKNISQDFINNINKLNPYDAIVELLYYSIIKNKQPIFTQDINIKINKEELNEYLKVKLYYGQSYISSLNILADKNNMYACADLGQLWFDGSITGEVDFNKSFEYYKKAADKLHPKACWMVANLILTSRVKYDFDTMWNYLNKSIELGSAAGYNTLGLCYKKGINRENKINLEKAKYYFELASNLGYVFAFNNLGLLLEEEKNIDEANKLYKISADMGNSWALNKLGEYYRKNNNYDLAFMYYNASIECPLIERNAYAYYNLAKYYYESGCKYVNIKPDKQKSKYYMEQYKKLIGE